MEINNPGLSTQSVESAIDAAMAVYFDGCRHRIDSFINKHFHYPGAWKTNISALGWDLLRAPFNLFWSPVYLICQILAWLFRKLGWTWLDNLLCKVPGGFTTTVQTYVAERISVELLMVDSSAPQSATALISKALDDLVEPEVNNKEMVQQLQPILREALARYGLTRTASADIANSLLSTIVGAFAFQKFTPGGLAIGLLLASWYAQKTAVENFFLGNFFGRLYYSFFPAEPSLALSLSSTALVLAVLAAFASFSGLITDPLQTVTRLHRYRLQKMIRHLQKDFESRGASTFSPKDPYLARILEILDAAKSHLV